MRNTDIVNYIGFSNGGTTPKGTQLGTKIRFASNETRRDRHTKNLGINIVWHALPRPMSRVDAINYAANALPTLDQAQREAVAKAVSRVLTTAVTNPTV